MVAPFRVALSGDFRKADGSPTFPDFDVKALQAAGQPVTLEAIYNTLGDGGMAQLSRKPGAEAFADRLKELEAEVAKLRSEAGKPLRRRLTSTDDLPRGTILNSFSSGKCSRI